MTDHLQVARGWADELERKRSKFSSRASQTRALIALAEQATRIADALTGKPAPAWIVPLTEDEGRESMAESGPVSPCEPRSPQTDEDASTGENGAQRGAEPARLTLDDLPDTATKADGRWWARRLDGLWQAPVCTAVNTLVLEDLIRANEEAGR